jgi:FMN-dependent NADH-azoreductase
LKAWIDHVARVRRTFNLGKEGKVATLRDRPVFVAVASGGRYSGRAARQPDFLTPYLKAIFGMIGLHDITFFSIEGSALPPEALAVIRAKTELAVDAHFSSRAPSIPDASAKQGHVGELPNDGAKLRLPASDHGLGA